MLLSLSLRTVVLVVIGRGRVECSGFCVLLKIVLGFSLLCLCSLAGGDSSWCCCSVHLHSVQNSVSVRSNSTKKSHHPLNYTNTTLNNRGQSSIVRKNQSTPLSQDR